MESSNQFTMCRDLVGGLADAGVSLIVVSPGSRNTPIAFAAAQDPRIDDVNIRDERSAGFIALGYAKATGRPAAVACTSGSAAAHYLPAIVEADQSGTPMIVLTSDRPVRLRGTGAPQTMDQAHLYGNHVKAFIDVSHTDGRSLAADLIVSATGGYPGPVHANLPFDEPLVTPQPVAPSMPSSSTASGTEPVACSSEYQDVLSDQVGRRLLFVVGGRQREGLGRELAKVSEMLGAPIVAGPQSRVEGENVIRHPDLLTAAHDAAGSLIALEELAPDLVVRLGTLPATSMSPIVRWMERSGVEQILVSDARLGDPLGSAATEIDCDPTAFLAAQTIKGHSDGEYVRMWRALDGIVGDACASAVESLEWPNEPGIARVVGQSVPAGSILWVASSRPIRDVDAFSPKRDDIEILANRGVNGIDGTISSAIGAALGGEHVTLLVGDIAVLHDATALSEAASLGVPLRIVAVNNDGGGIFEFLPQARSPAFDRPTFERHWGTPHGLSLAAIAAAMGMTTRTVDSAEGLERAVAADISGPEFIEIVTDRTRVLPDHEIVRRAVASALLGRSE